LWGFKDRGRESFPSPADFLSVGVREMVREMVSIVVRRKGIENRKPGKEGHCG